MKRYLRIDNHIYRLAQPSCPIRSELYGGMISGGGYESGTELEAGAQRIAEAAHCILGSLGRHLGGDAENWETMVRIEQGHLLEELGLIKDAIKEYSRPVYTDTINYPEEQHYKPEMLERVKKHQKESIERMAKVSSVLREKVISVAKRLVQQDLPKNVFRAAAKAYLVIGRLSEAVAFSVRSLPISNPFYNSSLREAVAQLDEAITTLLKEGPE